MENGYHVIEPRSLKKLIGNINNHDICVAIMNWILYEIARRHGSNLQGVTLNVIAVTYLGTSPAIGAQYENGEAKSKSDLVEILVEQIVLTSTVDEFVSYIGSSTKVWPEEWRKIRGDA